MSRKNFWHHLYSYPIVRVVLVALVLSFTAFVVSYFLPARYCSEAKILIRLEDKKLDSYRISETTNRSALVVKELVQTKDFIREVFTQAGTKVSEEELYDGYSDDITANSVKDSPVVTISACGSSASLAQRLNQKSLEVLQSRISTVLDKVKIEVVDPPALPPKPVFPRPLFQASATFGLVVLLGVLYYISVL